jgi:FkbM family methyltransferase
MSDLPRANCPPQTPKGFPRLGAFVVRHRRSLPMRKIAKLCTRYLSWYGNLSYDLQTNGEGFVVQTLAGFQPRVLLDAGANVGDWSIAAKRYCPGAEIHAFEIAQPTFEVLAANTRHLRDLHCENVGLSDTIGPIRIRYYDTFPAFTTSTDYHHPLASSELDARVITGDSYVARKNIQHIDLLKVDVEGMEERVLKGFQKTFEQRAIDLVQFEYGRVSIFNHFLLRDAYSFFRRNGFVLGKIYPNYVDFRDYEMSDEDFMGPNYLACREEMVEYIEAFRGGSNGAVSSTRA